MPGGTVQVAARRPSAQVTARWADTQRAQRPLVLRLTTAQRVASDSTRTLKGAMGVCSVMLVGMVQWKAPHRSAQATVRRVGTRGTQRQLAPRRTTASHVMPVGTVLALAQRRSAPATVRRVGTQRAQRQPAPRLMTASRVILGSMALAAARQLTAQPTANRDVLLFRPLKRALIASVGSERGRQSLNVINVHRARRLLWQATTVQPAWMATCPLLI